MAGTYTQILAIYEHQYASTGDNFHPEKNALAIDGALKQMNTLCADADKLTDSLASMDKTEGNQAITSLTALLNASAQSLSAITEQAKIADSKKIASAATLDQSAMRNQAKIQQDADAQLVKNVDELAKKIPDELKQIPTGESPDKPLAGKIDSAISIINTLPDSFTISAKITDTKAWPSDTKRPDKLFSSGTQIEAFASKSGQVEIYNPPPASTYAITIAFNVATNTSSSKTPPALFVNFDQAKVINNSASNIDSKDQFEKLASNQWISVMAEYTSKNNQPGVDFFISAPLEG